MSEMNVNFILVLGVHVTEFIATHFKETVLPVKADSMKSQIFFLHGIVQRFLSYHET